MDDDAFRMRYRHTAIWRTKRRGLQRNACIVLGNLRDPIAAPALAAVAVDPRADHVVRGHAAWALGRIGGAVARDALRRVASETAHLPLADGQRLRDEVWAAVQACE